MARTKQTARGSVRGNPDDEEVDNEEEKPSHVDENGNPIVYAPTGSLIEARNLYEGPKDKNGRWSWTTKYPDDLEDPPENADALQYALIVRKKKCYDGRRKLSVDSIVVQSDLIKRVLGTVLKDYPGVTTNLERLEFRGPFQPFVHRWERLEEARRTETDPDTKSHLKLLWDVLEEELRDVIREKNDHVSNGVVTFPRIWTIFEPGSLIYSVRDGQNRIFKLVSGQIQSTQCGQVFSLNCRFVDYDGEVFGWDSTTLNISDFEGTTPIIKLRSFPIDYHPHLDVLRNQLLSRGALFEQYQGYHYKAYQGVAIGTNLFGSTRYNIDSRIIIDTYAFNRFNPNRKVSVDFMKTGSDNDTGDHSDEDMDYVDEDDLYGPVEKSEKTIRLSEEQKLLCNAGLRGYSLKDKQWLFFFIDHVKEIVWNDHAFKSLVAPPEQKELVLAFAQSQAKSKGRFDDVIQGKGRGIIMLLSGPPGVGKTLTAESVAEDMKVPLYTMSAGDLGTDSSNVESSLANVLEMTTKWNAVLLLDEADVFLEARSIHDLERNKLVSIFLRMLEYYEGILFLTTNRVDNIDAAFESRIHLSLQYDDLDETSRRHVWNTFLKRSTNVGEFSNENMETLAKINLNGRQIKNVLKTAQLLASKKESDLLFEHVDTVLRLRAANSKKRSAYAMESDVITDS